jgi:hypothetical protein
MLPPNHLYSANIHNRASKPVNVTVHYESNVHRDNKSDTIPPNGSRLFDQVTYSSDGGSSTSIAPIKTITVKLADAPSDENGHRVEPNVQGVHQVKDFHIIEEGNRLKAVQQ